MANSNIYQDIAARTGGDIYIGVVGPVRTGKSTFIKNSWKIWFCPTLRTAIVGKEQPMKCLSLRAEEQL